MSLLEDVFLHDEAGEANELERIIEGDEFDERRPRSDSDNNSEKEDEAEEDKRRVDPSSTKTKRVIKNPRFILNPARLTGPRGMQVIPDHFKDFKFKGKGHEKEDLDLVLKKLEHWAYRLYPKFQFEDCLKKIETLGKKRPVMVNLTKIRNGQYLSEETVVQKDSSDDEEPKEPEKPPEDEFDKLLQQQIDLARSTPAPGSVKKTFNSSVKDDSPLTMPKATSSPSISDEQRERMIRNRKLAEERRLARLALINKNSHNNDSNTEVTNNESNSQENNNMDVEIQDKVKRNKSNVIDSDSSDEEISVVNTSITVDVHKNSNFDKILEETRVKTNNDPLDSNDEIEVVNTNSREIDKDVHFNTNLGETNDKGSSNNDLQKNNNNSLNIEINTGNCNEIEELNTDKDSLTANSKANTIQNSINETVNVNTQNNDKLHDTNDNDIDKEPVNNSNGKSLDNNDKIEEFNTEANEKFNENDTNVCNESENQKETNNGAVEEVMDVDFNEDF